MSFLFGSVATVSLYDVYLVLGLGLVVLVSVVLLSKGLFLISLDEELAQAQGVPVELYNYALMILTSIVVVLSIQIVGALLIGALLVIPVITALQLRRGFWITAVCSILFSVCATLIGLVVSYFFAIPSGGSIVLAAIGVFLLTLSTVKNS